MPGRNYSGGGSFYRNKMTRNIGPSNENVADGSPQRRDEKYVREAHKKERHLESYLADDENFPSFKNKLRKMGLQLRDIPADGNCLFRALGDQLEGHCRNHFRHRTDVVNFMKSHRLDFEPFVEDDLPFDEHVRNLQKLGTHAGNDAIVAFAKLHNVNVIIHQLNGKPLMIQGPANSTELTPQLHIAYHNGDHYSSVRKLDDNTESPAHIRLQEHLNNADCKQRFQINGQESTGGIVSAKREIDDIVSEVKNATKCEDSDRVHQCILECDYDVDASIAYLLQQLEMSNECSPDDTASLVSQQTCTTIDSGIYNGFSSHSGSFSGGHITVLGGSSIRNGASTPQSNVSSNGKGHKVHFREDSNSSGYGSISSNKGSGARPKVLSFPSQSARKVKESKKMEKKRRAEERHREKFLNGGGQYPANHHIPHATDVCDVTVVAMHEGRLTRI
ncbi:OTU domain-containing protein 3 [Biomphalaria pfeifferi]|uniref:OTU domain-containing protein 3 n=1 Tax=Biomphalaria pfeifferi TaxID=112525 RepID=A0AAD8F997_BIOPF|nr:OTU domain-containing protein 3 [Biomphalaria pfeifferi]